MRESTRETIFHLENVWFRYTRETDFFFRDLSVDIKQGESVALIGPSGEGKSSILKLMTGLLKPERGKSLFFGRQLEEMSSSDKRDSLRRIGMTFQNSGLFDSLSCGDNLKFPLHEAGQEAGNERIRKALADVELVGIENLRTHQISGGMRKRLGIARAHILSPEVVLYDEPTAGLDPLTSRAITDLILKLKQEHNVTVIVVTNDPAQAFQIADRILFVDDAKIVQNGTKEEIKASKDPRVQLYLNAFANLAPAGGAA